MLPSVGAISVMHTGTLSLRQMLLDVGYTRNKPEYAFSKIYSPEGLIYSGHTFDEGALKLHTKMPLITTLRNPHDVLASYASRYSDNGKVGVAHLTSLRKQYQDWLEVIVPNADVIIPIDLPERDERIREVERLLGVQFGEFPHVNEWKRARREFVREWDEFEHEVFDCYAENGCARV